MIKNFNKVLIAISVILLTACSSIKMTSQKDKTVDFNKFKTFSFYGWKGDTDNLTSKQIALIEKSYASELEQRGLTQKDVGGDMVLSFFIVVDRTTTQNQYNTYYGYGTYSFHQPDWGWGSNLYVSVSGFAMPPSTGVPYKENSYLQGTIVCDAFDRSTKKLVWQGVASKAIKPKKNKGNPEENIPIAVSKMIKSFPIKIKD